MDDLGQKLTDFISGFPSLSLEEKKKLVDEISLARFMKGTILLHQGDISTKCYFVLEGCVKQYCYTEDGDEKTVNFYLENDTVVDLKSYHDRTPSDYYFACLENCVLIVGNIETEQHMYQSHPDLVLITKGLEEQSMSKLQMEYAKFVTMSPEERYLKVVATRPELIQRVPQHQLASYLGIKPESLSRIKRRIYSKQRSR